MFERYTERARRVIFFARYEASMYGSTTIETEHLLLGLMKEDKNLSNRFMLLHEHEAGESIRAEIESRISVKPKVSTSLDLPLTIECKRILAYSAEEAERLNHRHIGTEHLLLGILREEKCMAAEILYARGLRLSAVQEELARSILDRPVHNNPNLPEAGCVPDADTAIRIAEAVWIPIVGLENVEAQRPFQALFSGAVWTVTGSVQTLVAIIRGDDGMILKLTKRD